MKFFKYIRREEGEPINLECRFYLVKTHIPNTTKNSYTIGFNSIFTHKSKDFLVSLLGGQQKDMVNSYFFHFYPRGKLSKFNYGKIELMI
jgi:hypothetical protein